MRPAFNESFSNVQRKLQSVSSLALDFLLPQTEVIRICEELEFGFRDRVHNPMVVAWMLIS